MCLTGAVLLDRNTHEHNVYRNMHTTECDTKYICLFVCLIVFNATFNNISVISWRSVLLVEETEDPEKTTDLSQVTEKLYQIMWYTSP